MKGFGCKVGHFPASFARVGFWRRYWLEDTDLLIRDLRGEIVAKQMVRSSGSISANFEEGYGQGTTPEFIHALRIANGEARATKGWYRRSKRFLPPRFD